MENRNFQSIKIGRKFRHNGITYTKKNANHAISDSGEDMVFDLLCMVFFLDIAADGELDLDFSPDPPAPFTEVTSPADIEVAAADGFTEDSYERPSYGGYDSGDSGGYDGGGDCGCD